MDRSKIEQRIEEIATEIVGTKGLSLVDVEYKKESGDWFLRIYIYKPEGVSIDDCEEVSNAMNSYLDEIDIIPGSYLLEVSSPGLERRLKKAREFEIFAGRKIKIHTYFPVDGRKDFRGLLDGFEDGKVKLLYEEESIIIPLQAISKAQLIYEP